jgi:hypothetical protein
MTKYPKAAELAMLGLNNSTAAKKGLAAVRSVQHVTQFSIGFSCGTVGVLQNAAGSDETLPGSAVALGTEPWSGNNLVRLIAAALTLQLEDRDRSRICLIGIISGEMP